MTRALARFPLLLVTALVAFGAASAAPAAVLCGSKTARTNKVGQGVRFFTVTTKVKGRTRVRLLACSARKPTPRSLAYGPPSLVSFGRFPVAGPYMGFEVIGVQSAAGEAGAGTNYNIGWVDSRSGQTRMSFTFFRPIRPPHRFVIDRSSGSIGLLVGRAGGKQELEVSPLGSNTINTAEFEVVATPDEGRIIPGSLAFSSGLLRYRTTTGARGTVDPKTGRPVAQS